MKKIWEALKKPFTKSDIEWRVCRSGITNDRPWIMCLCYVTNRAIMDRLDEVVGAENWKNEFKQAPEGGVLCGISIRVSENEWIIKWDGAENTEVEATKGGLSSAMKRAAVQWGIGRYLYRLEENFAQISDKGKFRAKVKDKTSGVYQTVKWDPPDLPEWATPSKGDTKSVKRTKPPKTTKIQSKKTIVEEKVTAPIVEEDKSLEEILDNPPKAVTADGSKKQVMINKIMKMSENMKSQDYESFKTTRVGDRGLVYLTDDELIKFGTELRDHLSEEAK